MIFFWAEGGGGKSYQNQMRLRGRMIFGRAWFYSVLFCWMGSHQRHNISRKNNKEPLTLKCSHDVRSNKTAPLKINNLSSSRLVSSWLGHFWVSSRAEARPAEAGEAQNLKREPSDTSIEKWSHFIFHFALVLCFFCPPPPLSKSYLIIQSTFDVHSCCTWHLQRM